MERGKIHRDYTNKDWTRAAESLRAALSEKSALGTYNSNKEYNKMTFRNCRLGDCEHQF